MPDGDDHDQEPVINDLVQDAIVTYSDAPYVFGTPQLDDAGTTRLSRELLDGTRDASLDGSVEPSELPTSGRQELDPVHR